MNLELLLAAGCWFSKSQEACISLGTAYYRYEKIDEQVRKIQENLPPSIVFATSLLSSVEKRKINVPLVAGLRIGTDFSAGTETRYSFGFDYGF